MQRDSLKRAVRLGGGPRGWWLIYLSGIISALIIPLMLIVLGLIMELLTTRGCLNLAANEAQVVAEWTGNSRADADALVGEERVVRSGERVQYKEHGLLPFVYRNQNHPLLGAMLVNRYRSSGWMRSNDGSLAVLLLLGALLAALESFSLALFYVSVRRSALDVGGRLRGAIYDQAFHLGVFDLLGDRVTQAEHLITEQVPAVEEGLARWWRAAVRSVVTLALCLLLAVLARVWLSVWLTLVTLLLTVLVALLFSWIASRTQSQVRLGADRASRELGRLVEQLRQVPLVAGFLLKRIPGEPRDEILRRHQQQAEQASTIGALLGPILHLVVMAGVALILYIVGLNILNHDPPRIAVSEAVVLGASLLAAFFPARRLYRLRLAMPTAERAATAILAYLDREPSLAEAAGARPVGRIRDKVELESVTLADGQGRKLLDAVSLAIPAGSKTAIVASDSSVPIALAGLLARFYDPAAGRILCDGHDVRTVTLQSLRQQASVVTGDGPLFSGTVSDNIACGEERFTQLQITDSAKQARAYNFIQQLPQGFATIVGQQGQRLETGQSFRIALARAALRDPSLLVVQEPRGEVDPDSGGHIEEALRQLAKERAVVLLPARLDTLRGADRVILIHQGTVVGQGTHTELIQSSELYRHLTYVRFNPYRGEVKAD